MGGSAVKPSSELGLRTRVRDGKEVEREEWNGLHLKFLDDESNQDLETPVPRWGALLAN